MSIFAQVWLWSLVAFVLGVLLTWVLLVRPAQARVRELERKLVASRSEPVHARPEYAGYDEPAYAAMPEPAFQPANQAESAGADDFEYLDQFEHFDEFHQEEPEPQQQAEYQPTALFEPTEAERERTEYLPPASAYADLEPEPYAAGDNGRDIGSALDPGGYYEPADEPGSEQAASRGLFQPTTPTTSGPAYEPEYEPVHEPAVETTRHELPEPLLDDAGPATESLPKRQPRDSPRGGFDPPEPIQPSMRTVTRREPVQDGGAQSGSLFEPSASAGDASGGQDLTPEPPPAPAEDSGGAQVGPFGPGSAMPLPGGAKPSEEFAVKASVTTLRYCPPESPRYDEIVAEVWFRAPEDAERVGFRPIS